MKKNPLLSFIVLSYNYERYIEMTIQSILGQTVQDFEIVVVDDFSNDNSVNLIYGIDDPRIRVICNEKNIGGAASYNRAVLAARGEWLVNVDADDWIAPDKAARQLALAVADPSLDIIGTYVSVRNQDGLPHTKAPELEAIINHPHDFNRLDTWIGANHLCRSSTMVRRATHLRIGLDDETMVRAPDYELWTRALREGCRFAIVAEQLTFMRLHSTGVTHADPLGTLLEMTYAMLRNLVPFAEMRALHPSIGRIVAWVCQNNLLGYLLPIERYRLIGMLLHSFDDGDFASFVNCLKNVDQKPELKIIGQRILSINLVKNPMIGKLQKDIEIYVSEIGKLQKDIEAFCEARDFWRAQSEAWESAYEELSGKRG